VEHDICRFKRQCLTRLAVLNDASMIQVNWLP